jgi:hypothetical protein
MSTFSEGAFGLFRAETARSIVSKGDFPSLGLLSLLGAVGASPCALPSVGLFHRFLNIFRRSSFLTNQIKYPDTTYVDKATSTMVTMNAVF